MRARRWLAPVVVWLALAACGDGAGRGIADDAAGPLAERVAAVRAAAAEDRGRALAELAALREEVAAYAGQGDLSETATERILTAADAVEAALVEPPATAPTTAPPPTATTTTATPQEDREQRRDEAEPREQEEELEERQREEQKELEEEQKKRDEEQRKRAEEQQRDEEKRDDDDKG